MSVAGKGEGIKRVTFSRWWIGIGVATGLILLFLANGHLVYVALNSQPDCVTHTKENSSKNSSFRAAKSSC